MTSRSVKLLGVAAMTATAMMASPTTTTLTWVGVGSDPTYSNEYVGPYYVDVGSSTKPTAVTCDDFNDEVNQNTNQGVTYNVLTDPVSTSLQNTLGYAYYSSQKDNNAAPSSSQLFTIVTDYEEIAWLTLQFANPNVTANSQDWGAIQTAIWSFFGTGVPVEVNSKDPNGTTANDYTSTQYWINQAASNFGSIEQSGITVYTPAPPNGTSNQYFDSQEFVTYAHAPEPATYAIFGSGLILLFLGKFRRGRNKSSE
jgi:hypothetical protein